MLSAVTFAAGVAGTAFFLWATVVQVRRRKWGWAAINVAIFLVFVLPRLQGR